MDHDLNVLVKFGGPTMLLAKMRSYFTNTLVSMSSVCEEGLPLSRRWDGNEMLVYDCGS